MQNPLASHTTCVCVCAKKRLNLLSILIKITNKNALLYHYYAIQLNSKYGIIKLKKKTV